MFVKTLSGSFVILENAYSLSRLFADLQLTGSVCRNWEITSNHAMLKPWIRFVSFLGLQDFTVNANWFTVITRRVCNGWRHTIIFV